MISDAVKIARSQERVAMVNAARDILTNPAVDLILGYIIFEYLSSYEEDVLKEQPGTHQQYYVKERRPGTNTKSGWFGPTAGTIAEGALVANLGASSIGSIAKDLKPFAEALAPLMLTKGL